MKRALMLAALLVVVAFAHNAAPMAVASQYCSTTCSGGTVLQCNASTTCSSAPGTLTCCGATYNCDAANAFKACTNICTNRYNICRNNCTTFACLHECSDARFECTLECGPPPQTTFDC